MMQLLRRPRVKSRGWSWRKRSALLAGLVLVGMVGVMMARTAMLRSRQIKADPIGPVAIHEGAIERFATVLRFKTVSDPAQFDPEEFRRMHRFLKQAFPNVHTRLEREVIGECSLLYLWPGSDAGTRPILLMSHLDVVPVSPVEETRWTHDPWSGTTADGYIWGRGALDVKCGVMSMLEAVEHLLKQEFRPSCDVYFAFGHDEEVGGANGNAQIARLLRGRGVQFRFVLDEGGGIVTRGIPGLEKPLAMIGVAEKGYATVRLTARDDPGHSSIPPRQTAVGALSTAVAKLEQNQRPASLAGPVGTMLDYIGPEMGFVERFATANRDLLEPLLLSRFSESPLLNAFVRTTTAATVIHGGQVENVLPAKAEALVNFRLLPGDTPELVDEHVRRIIDDPRIDSRVQGLAIPPSFVSDHTSQAFRDLQAVMTGLDPSVIVAPSLAVVMTDSRHYEGLTKNTFRFLPMRLGTDELSRIHGVDERISIENYIEMVRFMIELLQKTSSGGAA